MAKERGGIIGTTEMIEGSKQEKLINRMNKFTLLNNSLQFRRILANGLLRLNPQVLLVSPKK